MTHNTGPEAEGDKEELIDQSCFMAESPSSPINLHSNPVHNNNVTPQSDRLSPPSPPPKLQQPPPLIFPSPSFPYYLWPFSAAVSPPVAPSFRTVLPRAPPHFSLVPNYDDPAVQPPGVSSAQPIMSGGYKVGEVLVEPPMLYQSPQPPILKYDPMPNRYAAKPHLGLLHYPSPYMPMVPPAFAPAPLGTVGPFPFLPGVLGARPISPLATRPYILPSITPVKPHITVFVGKISATVENDFMLSLLQLCGQVKSWKRADNPINGTPMRFGFCEFATAEGALRALRLLDKFNVDGQELELNVNQSTKEYLEQYIEKKSANLKKLKETREAGTEKDDRTASGAEKSKPATSSGSKERQDSANFRIVTNSDTEMDRFVSEMLAVKVEERLKTRPLSPPPPPPAANGSGNSNSELTAKSKDADTYVDMFRNDETKEKNEDMTSEKSMVEQDRLETISPGRNRRYDRRSRDRERDLRLDKVREIERYEKEERERKRKEREQRWKIEEATREYANSLKKWERVESRREKQWWYEEEDREERECRRKRKILEEEEEYSDDNDDDDRKWGHRSEQEKKRKRRLRELENDLADMQREEEEITDRREKRNRRLRELENDFADREREEEEIAERREKRNRRARELENDFADKQREEEEIAESKKRAEEELKQQQRDALKLLPSSVMSGSENHMRDISPQIGIVDDSRWVSVAASDTHQSVNVTGEKLRFDLVGSKKKPLVSSVFHKDDYDAPKEKKMGPQVPIDHSTEKLQSVHPTVSGAQPPNLAAAAEFAKPISNVNSKEEDSDKKRGRCSHDRSNQLDRGRDQNNEDANWNKDDAKDKVLDRKRAHRVERAKTPDDKKHLDGKQLIDMIPKMMPQVPIDHSTEKLQSVYPTVSGAQPPNLAAAAEFAKPISNVSSKEEDSDKKRGRCSHDRSNQRGRGKDQNYEDANWNKDDAKDKVLDRKRAHRVERAKTPDDKKHLDGKQLIDMIPKMMPQVPIDHSTEKLQSVYPTVSGAQPPNLAAAAEFAKPISNVSSKEEDSDKKRGRCSHDRSNQRGRGKDQNYEDANWNKDDAKDKVLDRKRAHRVERAKTPDDKKHLDGKQLIDMIPKMMPQVPIDHSTEKLQSVYPTVSGAQPPNLAAAAEFAKPISNVSSKEEDSDKKRGRCSHDRSNQRGRGKDQNYEDANWNKDDAKDKVLDRKRAHRVERAKTPDDKKHLDGKQLIDMIPKMMPQVPIDHSTEKLQSVYPTVSGAQPPNRGRDQNNEDANWNKDDAKDKVLDRERAHRVEKAKTSDNKKHLDAKQLIDIIPKTKEELFSYEINWAVYDKHDLHEIIRPWISKKIVEFMGDEEPTLVDYIESTTQEHVKASEMVEMLLPTLDEETEMFVLEMWMLLIFEIKKVETGLST